MGRATVENWCVSGCGEVQQKAVHKSCENVPRELAYRCDGQAVQKLQIMLAEVAQRLDIQRTLHCVDRERRILPQLLALLDSGIGLAFECIVFS